MPTRATTDPTDDHAAAIGRLLASLADSHSEPAALAYRAALKRHGRELAQAGGAKAMRAVLDQVGTTGARRVAVLNAWEGIPGWYLGAVA